MKKLNLIILSAVILLSFNLARAADLIISGQNGRTYQNTNYDKLIITNSSDITIQNCNFSSATGAVVDISSSSNIRIENADINGLATACTGINTDGNSHYIYVNNSDIHDIADDGAQLGGSHIYFTSNRIYRLYGVGTAGTNGTGSCYNGHSDGIELINVTDSEFIGNLIYDVRSNAAVFMLGESWHCSNLTFKNNIFYTPESGFVFYIQNVEGIQAYNNIIWQGIWGGAVVGPNVTKFYFYNNITHSINYTHFGASQNMTEHHIDYNLIGSLQYQGYTANTHDIVSSNPQFTNIAAVGGAAKRDVIASDFKLQSTSPVINNGINNIYVPNTDFFGNSRSSLPDIGAVEFIDGGGSVGSTVPEPRNLMVLAASSGGSTTTPPADDGSTTPPADDGSTTPPADDGSTAPPADDGSTAEPTVPSGTYMASTLSQNGITWTFSENVEYGQFVNGDYFVIDPGSGVTITRISPPSTSGSRTINGSMINPDPVARQGYDEAMQYVTYSDELNAALDVSSSKPLVLHAGQSLCSSISNTAAAARPQLTDMAILTCLSSVPPDGSFRPPYAGPDKTVKYRVSDIDYSVLGKLNPLSGAPKISSYETMMKKVWYEAITHFPGQFPRASNHMPGMVNPAYGADMATWSNVALLLLNCNYENSQKEKLLVYMLQYAIDISGAASNGTTWGANGGHGHGRKSVLALGAKVFNDDVMLSQLDASKNNIFAEDLHIWAITANDYTRTISGHSSENTEVLKYTSATHPVGTPEWGWDHIHSPASDNASRRAVYRSSWGSNIAGLLSSMVLGLESTWNRKITFDYAERFMYYTTLGTVGQWGTYTPSSWVKSMYNTYWSQYRD